MRWRLFGDEERLLQWRRSLLAMSLALSGFRPLQVTWASRHIFGSLQRHLLTSSSAESICLNAMDCPRCSPIGRALMISGSPPEDVYPPQGPQRVASTREANMDMDSFMETGRIVYRPVALSSAMHSYNGYFLYLTSTPPRLNWMSRTKWDSAINASCLP